MSCVITCSDFYPLSNRINLFMVINIWGIIIYDSASFPILWACYKSLITVITLKIVFYKGMIIKLTNEDTVTKVYPWIGEKNNVWCKLTETTVHRWIHYPDSVPTSFCSSYFFNALCLIKKQQFTFSLLIQSGIKL